MTTHYAIYHHGRCLAVRRGRSVNVHNMTSAQCSRAGESVSFMRCGTLQRATIIGYDFVSAGVGGPIVCGSKLADPRYLAQAPNGMHVAVCESEVIA